MKKDLSVGGRLVIALAAYLPYAAQAQVVVNDNLTGGTSSYPWVSRGGACLTAGDSSKTSSIPPCVGLGYYGTKLQVGGTTGRMPDLDGFGALRLTNGGGEDGKNQAGSVVSSEPFATSEGVQVTFSTVTYGGNGAGTDTGTHKAPASGADGITFYLLNGSEYKNPTVGAIGGSLGYSCSNVNNPADGVVKGYLGVAMDEYGNFSNPGDNTITGTTDKDGGYRNPGTIAVRGAGNINWTTLNAAYPKYYPTTLPTTTDGNSQLQNQAIAINATCSTGLIQDATKTATKTVNQKKVSYLKPTTVSPNISLDDYKLLSGPTPVVGNSTIYSQEGVDKPLRRKANVFTYALKITSDSKLSLSYAVSSYDAKTDKLGSPGATTAVITDMDIKANNGTMPASFLFGFSSGTGGGTNVHEITCFKAAALNTAANSAGSNTQQSAKVIEGTQIYLSYYHPLNSWGQLLATGLSVDTSNIVTVNGNANWDGNCVLTGGACSATGSSNVAQDPTKRTILSWQPAVDAVAGTGIAFEYDSSKGAPVLTADQMAALGTAAADQKSRIDFLRGVRSLEADKAGGVYRKRTSVLGDIRSSSPTFVGVPSLAYTLAGKDLVRDTTVAEFGSLYAAYVAKNKTRTNVVYNGANDGMLHGFRAGASNADGTYNATNNDGQEVIAYVPDAVIKSIHSATNFGVDFSSPSYAHNYFVDATPATGDLYYNGDWHTWLVSGLGAGGNPAGANGDTMADSTGATVPAADLGVLFALDITSPNNFSEANASTIVQGEWNSNNLKCVNDVACSRKMGSQYGTPIIRKLHDGNWAVIFGNGRNSLDGAAGIYIMTVNYTDGSKTFRYLDTASSGASGTVKNGIESVASADLDNDHVTDYIYAGDTLGNVWRFDLTSASPGSWNASKLFAAGATQPISTRLAVSSVVQANGAPRVVLNFGTGRQTPQTLTAGSTYATGSQNLYGLWDWNMTAWNALSKVQYASLPTTQPMTAVADLQTQTLTDHTGGNAPISGYRTETQNPVCWKGATLCSTGNTQLGWKVPLPVTGEQVIYSPVVVAGVLYYNTFIPGLDQALSCTSKPAAGFTMAISPETGGALTDSAFQTAATQAGINPGAAIIVGIGVSATGTPSFVTAGGNTFMVQQTVTGIPVVVQIDPAAGSKGKRITWRKLR